jgi:hypothetical protein
MPLGTDPLPVTDNPHAGDATMFRKPAVTPSLGGVILHSLFGVRIEAETATAAPSTVSPTTVAPQNVAAAAVSEQVVTTDIAEHLARLVGRTGSIVPVMGGFQIRVSLAAAFPFAMVLTALVRRNFRVDVAQRESGLLIEARP